MARTWSNAKKTNNISPAQRAKAGRPSGFTAFLILLVVIVTLFSSIMFYTTVYTLRHPPTENYNPVTQQPKDD